MKKLLIYVGLLVGIVATQAAAQTVKIAITVGAQTVEATVSTEAVAAMTAFIAEQKKDDGTPKYASIVELIISHFRRSLAVPLVERYSSAVKAAQETAELAAKAAEQAVQDAATGAVVVKP